MEEITRGRSSYAVTSTGPQGQGRLVIPQGDAQGGHGITFYRVTGDGWVNFKIHAGGQRKVRRAGQNALCWAACLPMTVSRRLALPKGTHEIAVTPGDDGTLKFQVDQSSSSPGSPNNS